jgi:lipoprotein-anchoring transpeptidase ErfK/SrfK
MRDLPLHPLQLLLVVTAAIVLGVALLQLGSSGALGASSADLLAAGPPAAPASAPAPGGDSSSGGGGAPAPEGPGALVADPAVQRDTRRLGGVACAQPHRVARIAADTAVHRTPGGARIGAVPAQSAYLGSPMYAWVQEVSRDGGWGRVSIPWSAQVGSAGWIRLDPFDRTETRTLVVADLSDRTITVHRGCRAILRVRSAVGRAGSPSPTGRFWVTDRVQVPGAQRASFGSFAFGLSTVQPNLPAGWTGGDQMAIHGTGAPGSIGQAASAGCLRVREDALRRLKPLLRLGTPVVIQP